MDKDLTRRTCNTQKGGCCNLYELPLTHLLLGNAFRPGGLALTRQLAQSAVVGPGSRVLDMACGMGDTARFLAGEYGARVTGLDRSETLLRRAQQETQSAGLNDQIHFHVINSKDLPFTDDHFDAVFCECALCLFDDGAHMLREFLRVLKPGGRLALSDVMINAQVPSALQKPLADAMCIGGAYSVESYIEMVTEAGFSALRIKDVSHVLVELIERIEKRLQMLDVIVELQKLEQEFAADDIQHTLVQARDFIYRQGIGYSLITARKPLM